MFEDEYVEVAHESWFGRLRDSCMGIVFGLLFFVVGFPLLFWNEGRAVQTFKTLQEGAGSVVSIGADSVDVANDRKLVHMSGTAQPKSELVDEMFEIKIEAIELSRKAEMYQWEETKSTKTEKKVGGGTEKRTTYRYKLAWSTSRIDSSHFKRPDGHENPRDMPYDSRTQTAQEVSVGAFQLSYGLINQIKGSKKLSIPQDIPFPAHISALVAEHNGGLYFGNDPGNPEIGDTRMTFSAIPAKTVSLLARQSGNQLIPYKASTGKDIEILKSGSFAADEMFAAAQAGNVTLTWILRGAVDRCCG